jgi:hypothetical protein
VANQAAGGLLGSFVRHESRYGKRREKPPKILENQLKNMHFKHVPAIIEIQPISPLPKSESSLVHGRIRRRAAGALDP